AFAHPTRSSVPVRFGELRRVGELLEFGDLAIAEGKNVRPIAGDGAAGLANLPGVMAEYADPIVGGEEFARREAHRLLVLRDALEELLHPVAALPAAYQRVVLAAAVDVPIHVEGQSGNNAGDITAPEGGVEALDEGDIGAAHGSVSTCDVG